MNTDYRTCTIMNRYGPEKIVQFLVSFDIDPNQSGTVGDRPFHIGNYDLNPWTKLYIQSTMNTDYRTCTIMNRYGPEKIVQFLISFDIDPVDFWKIKL